MKYSFLIVLSVIILFSQQIIAQPLPNLQTKIFNEVNVMRKNPVIYYQKYRTLFEAQKNAASFFKFVGPIPALIWSDSLHKEAKNAVLTKYKADGKFAKSFCGYGAFGASHEIEDSAILKFILGNYTTLLSTDYQAIGIYSETRNDRYFNKDHFSKSSYAYIGTNCNVKQKKYSFPGKKNIIDTTKVDFKMLNTGAKCSYMNAQEKEMLKEINFARCYPKIYSQIMANSFIEKGNILSFNDYIAGQEIVEELSKMQPLNKLLPDERLYKSAKMHGQDEVKRGYGGHTGSDNSSPFDRIKKILGDAYIEGQENLVGGSSPIESVMDLLIDGGIGSRGHRYNVIDPRWTHVGCYYAGKIGDMPDNYVQNFAIIK